MGDQVAGYYLSDRNLTYVLIHEASHMVPVDHPKEALDMFNRFIGVKDNAFNSSLLPSKLVEPQPDAKSPKSNPMRYTLIALIYLTVDVPVHSTFSSLGSQVSVL